METGHGTAGDRHKEDGEKIQILDFKTNESGHIERRILDEDAENTADNHADQKEHREIVARLFKEPHRHHRSGKEVRKHHIAPRNAVQVDRICDADPEHQAHEHDADHELNARCRTELLQVEAKEHRDKHVKE